MSDTPGGTPGGTPPPIRGPPASDAEQQQRAAEAAAQLPEPTSEQVRQLRELFSSRAAASHTTAPG